MSDIKLGVSLYSFSTEFIHEKLDLEGVLKKARDMGDPGIEIVAAQMAPGYPYPSDEWNGSRTSGRCSRSTSSNRSAGAPTSTWASAATAI